MTVSRYVARFTQLFEFTFLLVALKSQKAQKFLKGLCVDIYDRVAMLRPSHGRGV